MTTENSVKIPVEWLLTLAVHGNMGDGEIPDIMQRWAKNKLIEAGYQKEYSDRQREKIKEATPSEQFDLKLGSVSQISCIELQANSDS